DGNHARLKPSGRPQGLADVAAPDRSREAVGSCIGEPDGLVLGVEGNDRDDGSEDLLGGDPHVVSDAVEYGRHDVGAVGKLGVGRWLATDDDLGALAPPDRDVVEDSLALLLADERPDLSLIGFGVADLELPRRGGKELD